MVNYFLKKPLEEFKFEVSLVYLSQILLLIALCHPKIYVHVLTSCTRECECGLPEYYIFAQVIELR